MVLMIHPLYGMDKEAKHKLTHTPLLVKKIKAALKATENQIDIDIGGWYMTRRVNYEDNIFYLTLIFKGISASLKLNIDTDLYRDRIIEDIRFLDKTSASIYQSLISNHLMIDRFTYLKGLHKLNSSFIALLEDILEERLPLASALEQDFDLLQRIQSNRETELAGINEMITIQKGSTGDQEQIVSEEEFKFLLSAEEQEQESQS